MIKSIALAHRKAGWTREEFSKYWFEQHGPMAAGMFPGLRKYVQNHFISIPGQEHKGDGIVEMWWDDIETFQKSMDYLQTAEGKVLAMDGAKFSEMHDGGLWVVEERILKDELNK